jgi:DNA-binding LacI/PurR family transcriptional regulator
MKLRHKSLRHTLAETIEADLAAGVWDETLPGVRVLAARYGVSKKTCGEALKLLEISGTIPATSARTKRKLPTPQKPKKQVTEGGVGTVIIVSDISVHNLAQCFSLMERFAHFWEVSGGFVRRVTVDYTKGRSVAKLRREWCEGERIGMIVAIQAPGSWTKKMDEIGVPVFLCGGSLPAEPKNTSRVGFPGSSCTRDAIAFVKSRGHREILLPYPRPYTEIGKNRKTQLRAAFDDMTAEDVEKLTPAFDVLNPGDWRGFWRHAVRNIRPSCVILGDAIEAVTFVSFCASEGLRVPADISVFVLDGGPLIEWIFPAIAHHKIDDEQDWREFRRWMRDGFPPGRDIKSRYVLVEGESVADVT